MKNNRKPSLWNKLLLSAGFIVFSSVYAAWQNQSGENSTATTAPPTTGQPTTILITPATTPIVPKPQPVVTVPKPTPAPVTTMPRPVQMPGPMMPKPAGQYTDGSYTGAATDAFYGIVQVKAVVTGGRLVDVQFLQFPNDRSTSREISAQAMPLLTQEAIAAQSAQVNGVSGATATSDAFVQSLGSALAQAKI